MSVSLAVGLLSALIVAGPATGQDKAVSPPAAVGNGVMLTVTGKVPKPLKLDAEGFARLPRQKVRVKGHDGNEAEYEGVPLAELLKASGLSMMPDDLRGDALVFYVIVEASDGYRVLFALPELSPAYTDRVILLADRCNGKPIDGKQGPLRVVVPGEKRQARWVRQVTGLKVGRN